MEEYQALFSGLTKTEQKALASTTHAANKKIAEDFDKAAKLAAEAEEAEAAELKRRGVIPE